MSTFAITGARVFDGTEVIAGVAVNVADGVIESIGEPTVGYDIVDATGCTLLPGLIDAHVHAGEPGLREALRFGVTTELDMLSMPDEMADLRRLAAESNEVADVRSPSVGLTPSNGHPHQVRAALEDAPWPVAETIDEVEKFVDDRLAEGADYIKVLIEDGHVLGFGVPALSEDMVREAVRVAHDRGVMVLAHAFTLEATLAAVDAGVDGLTHVFLDQPHTSELVDKMVAGNTFLIATLSTAASIAALPFGKELAEDDRVIPKLNDDWLGNLSNTWGSLGEEYYLNAQNMVQALFKAGGLVLCGTDAAHVGVPGLAHGASVHAELKLLVRAGMSPLQALTSATSATASRFGLDDRGRVAPGLRADLVLVEGDPTMDLDHTLDIRRVWRGGAELDLSAFTLSSGA